MKPANFAPIYCAMYSGLAEITRKHGYALCVHGSLARDFDLVCVPWIDSPAHPQDVVDEITATYSVKAVNGTETKEHGRLVYTLLVGFGDCFMDFSFMPTRTSYRPGSVWNHTIKAVADKFSEPNP